ncbi:unnamed protein product [Chrysoparadoxa australica]
MAPLKVKRCTLTTEERQKVDGMREVLSCVFTSFESLDKAVADLETEPAPYVELVFYGCLAEAYEDYFGNAILIRVAKSDEGEKGDESEQQGTKLEEKGAVQGYYDDEEGDDSAKVDNSSLVALKTLDKTKAEKAILVNLLVPEVKRKAILSRLFYITQVAPEELNKTLELVREKGNAAGVEAIRDANLLTSWSTVRMLAPICTSASACSGCLVCGCFAVDSCFNIHSLIYSLLSQGP